MENKKYTKETKIYKFKLGGSGRWTNYQRALSDDELDLLKFAQMKGYVVSGNDAPRGGKSGDFFKVVKYFTTNSMSKKRAEFVKAREAELNSVLESEKFDEFSTISDIGSFKIDGVCYSNFYGDGENRCEVCRCDEEGFKTAEMLTRRQVYNKKEPLTIVKFDAPKTISVAISDGDDSFGARKVENALGFCIWCAKLKIFVKRA